ncbi:MAG: T9SS type A sorting domain-containing protein [Ignavibacteriaceae bacterium]
MKHFLLFILLVIFLFLYFNTIGFAKGNSGNNKKQQKTLSTYNNNTYIDINNLEALESNQGFSDYNINSNLEGMQFPKGSGKSVIFTSGLLWGGFVSGDSQVRVGGSAYISGLEPGPILSNGQAAANPYSDSRWRIYRVRADVYPGGPTVDLTSEANLEGTTTASLRTQYETDWTEWPAAGTSNDLGAPFTDVNGDGKYEPNIDIPGINGADQTVYYVANDLDPNLTTSLYGTQPMGIELHATYWAYNDGGALGNMYFKKYTLINKGYQHNTVNNMFISFWADPDLGYAGDDLVGTDTTLNLIYTYNGEPVDQVYAPATPPSVGFSLLEGPMVDGNTLDTALFNGNKIPGKKNLQMTSSYFFVNGNANFGDPPLGSPTGATQFYNFLNGNYGLSGLPFINPINNEPTKFVFSGNPVTGTGWLDGVASPMGDRRQGMASGPFTFAPGDTQEVVFAEIAGEGIDYLHSIYTVKQYQYNAKIAFKNLLNGVKTPLPIPPVVNISNNNDSVQIQWQNNSESFNQSGYIFEGYNLYQLPTALDSKESATLIATYDKVDGIKTIYGQALNPQTDQITSQIQQSGNDSGLQYSFTTSKDYINNSPFIKGKHYYYAVTAYSFNQGAGVNPNNTESNFQPVTIDYNYNLPGPNYGDQVPVIHSAGQSNSMVNVTIVDPSKLTGDEYEISFHDEKYMLSSVGNWTDITATGKKMGKVKDLTGSSLTSAANWSAQSQFSIHYLVNVVSSNLDYCEGVLIRLPVNLVVDTIFNPISNNTGSTINYTFNKATNTLFFGDSSRSGNGIFAGGEDITILSHSNNLPIITDYTMYDDGYGGTIVDVNGIDTLTKIANSIVTQHQWNVKDLTTENIVLQNQTILNGQDIYAPESYFAANSLYGPGGSSGSFTPSLGAGANVIFDGIQVALNGSYNAPTTIGSIVTNVNANSNFNIQDFTAFGYTDGTAEISLPLYGGAGGTTDINSLLQDYELKWTGVLGDTTINGHTVVITKSGGSIATIFGASNYSIANHPLNPNPGSKNPFTIRIPFEVWNITKNEQVNLLVYDRNYNRTNDPTKDGFEVWNEHDRVYTWVVNTKYTPTVISPTSAIVADSATWNWYFANSVFTTGDDIKIIYNNPLQIGKDKFTFTVPVLTFSLTPAIKVIKEYSLSQNYPNPFNPTTIISYSVPKAGLVTIKVYDILGREITQLVNEHKDMGTYNIEFNAIRLATGVYFYRMQAGSFVDTKKLLLLK